MLNRPDIYNNIRRTFGKLSASQVEGFEAFFNEWEKRKLTDLRWLAYTLATAWHEVATRMQPIEEFGKGRGKKYGIKSPVTGKYYYGRGHTQNTWEANYRKLTAAAKAQGYNWDFANKPELLLQMDASVWATFHAMTTGLYTGRKLADHFNASTSDPIGARRIINGNDKAILIAGYYHKFMNCLQC